MHYAAGYGKALLGPELDELVLRLNQQSTLDDIEELFLMIMLVLVKFALDDTETDDGLIDLT